MNAMSDIKAAQQWMQERGVSLADLVAASELEPRVVEAILQGRYTPSPQQRKRLSAALGIGTEQVAWGHLAEVQHVYGHGPQFGRSP